MSASNRSTLELPPRQPPLPGSTPAASASDAEAGRLIEAGQVAERAGRRQEARSHFEAALYRLSGEDSGARAASLLRWIARTYVLEGDAEAAMDCAAASLAVAQASGDRANEGHAINVQGTIHWMQGELDLAETLYRAARACALEADERALVAMTSVNLGTIAAVRGDLPEALHHFSVALENYRVLDRTNDVCIVLNNVGRLHTDMRRWPEAERAYEEAIEIAVAAGDRNTRIGIEVNVAEMWFGRGDAPRAADALQRATALSAETGNSVHAGQIAKLRGMLRRDAGAAKEAEQHFAEAAALAESRQDLLLLAETLRESAELYQAIGRNREALQNLNRAHRLFTQLRAKRELANVDRSVSRIENDFVSFVRKWGESIEAKDRYTQGHCVRVADLACAIALACGIEGQSLFWFRIGALLHDVGKLVVPSEVLNKPGKLTDEEWALMRSHPSAGVDMLAGIEFPWDVRPLIESHHERWDGKGYPHGLSGEEIPLSARILAVADVYDALTSVRSYKSALSHETALDVMRRDIGTAFDAEVFAKFEDVLRDASAIASIAQLAERQGRGLNPSTVRLEPTAADAITGLPTRVSMERITTQALADRKTTHGMVSLVVIEIDGAGPAVDASISVQHRRMLRWIARELRNVTRTSDFVARTGDWQFMALLPDSTARQAQIVVRRVDAALSARLRRVPGPAANGSSIRIAAVTAPENGETPAELFASAERATAESAPQIWANIAS